MFLASLRANNAKYIRIVAGKLVADQEFPSRETDMLIENLTHPSALHLSTGDLINIRSCATNGLWSVYQDHILRTPGMDFQQVDDALVTTPLELDARWSIARAVGTVKQNIFVRVPSETPPIANFNAPVSLNLYLQFPVLWNGPQMATPTSIGTVGGVTFHVSDPGNIGNIGGMNNPISIGGSTATTTAPVAIPDQAEISETAFACSRGWMGLEMTLNAAHRVNVKGRGRGVAHAMQNWFYLTPHMIRARFRAADGKFLNSPGGGAIPLSSSATPSQTQEFSITRISSERFADAYGYKMYHNGQANIRNSSGQLLCLDNLSAPTKLVGARTINDLPANFTFERANGTGEILDGDWITLMVSNKHVKINADSTVTLTAAADATKFMYELTKEIHLFKNAANEFAALADPVNPTPAGFTSQRSLGRVFIGPRPETVPVRSFTTDAAGTRFFTSALVQGSEVGHQKNFMFRGVEGYAFPHTDLGTFPTKLYWHDAKKLGVLASTKADEEAALAAGYVFNWIDGHFLPSKEYVAFIQPSTAAPIATAPMAHGTVVSQGLPSGLLTGNKAVTGIASTLHVGGGVITSNVTIPPRPVRALVLSGGGAKGCFEVGVAKYLWDQGWRPDIVCGVSVGSVNAVKLAENQDATVDELITQWKTFSAAPDRIFYREMYLNFISHMAGAVAGKAEDAGIAAGISALIGGVPGAVAGLFAGKEASQLDKGFLRLINVALNLFHSLHCMQPLRDLLSTNLNYAKLASSGVKLRIGVTDIQTGQFYTVAGPDAALHAALPGYGTLEAEPDHALGDTWLTSPIMGVDKYAMKLDHAVYGSSTLPVFMDPLTIKLKNTRKMVAAGKTLGVLDTGLVSELTNFIGMIRRYGTTHDDLLEPLLDQLLTHFPQLNSAYLNQRDRYGADQDCGERGNTRLMFDGGLRDTMPIRTALRLGATEIIAVTGDRIQQAPFARPSTASLDSTYAQGILSMMNGKMFNGVGQSSVTPFSYLLGLLNIWLNEASRSDMLLSWAGNELKGWVKRGSDQMTPDQARRYQDDFHKYWQAQGKATFEAIGASSFMGGRPGSTPYGDPWTSAAAKIQYIAPDRDYIDALNFDDAASVDDGIRLGYEAARNSITISNPVVG